MALSVPVSKPYVWKNVQMVGGGFVDGIIFHPTAKGVCYARTDMGGAYRWNDKDKRWDPITDWISYKDRNSMGVESIAVDPSDPDRVYLACGTYTGPDVPNASIFRSNDRGKTFQRTDMPFKMGGNEDGRGNGERLMVDPHDGKILYFGSRNDGLWKSTDCGITWHHVDSFPDIKETLPAAPPADPNSRPRRGFRGFWQPRSSGIVTVVFDPASGSNNKTCSTIYVVVSLMNRDNLFCSKDSGLTWQPVAGQPTQYRPNHAVLASNGVLYISYGTAPGPSRSTDGGVWKYNTRKGLWTDITPEKSSEANSFGYAAVSVDASNPDVVIASTHYRQPDELFRTTDGGKTWKPLFKSGAQFVYDKAPYVKRTGIHWMFDIEINPTNPNHAIFTTGYGGHETFNLTDADKNKATVWSVMSTGIEETVALELLSPTKGASLITAIGDYGGFVHWDLDKPAPEGSFDNPPFGNTNGVACADLKPQIIVRVGNPTSSNRDGSGIAWSQDEGKTWQPANPPQPGSRSGYITVSADGRTWVWTPGRMAAFYTQDRGASWKECSSLPTNTRVIADRINPKKFYAMDLFKGKLFISTDSAATFTEQPLALPNGLPKPPTRGQSRGDVRGGQDRLYATPGKEGDLWLAAFDGLYHSTDIGKSFVKLDGVQEMLAFGFGKAAPKADYPALYMIGVMDGVRGVFHSDDTAKTWIKINDDQHRWGLVLHITGDPKKYGRAYVGTHGRGTLYGDPAE
jgi:photosystem II stability/assembly factor-like uncharacterized protein